MDLNGQLVYLVMYALHLKQHAVCRICAFSLNFIILFYADI